MSESKSISLATAVEVESLTRPAPGTTEGKRTKKLITEVNDTIHDSKAFKDLQKRAQSGLWTREKFDEEARKLGLL